MSGGAPAPPDNSVQLRQLEIDEERRRAEERQRQEEEERARFENRLGSAFDSASGNASQVLASRGLQEDEFLPIILQDLQRVRSSVPDLDPNPGSYFEGAIDNALNVERDRRRANLGREISQFAPTGFARTRIADTLDDDAITALVAEDFTRALTEANRALERGALNQTGFEAARSELDRQRPGVNAGIQDIGGGILEEGRQSLRDIADAARLGASSYELGNTFQPLTFKTDIDETYTAFRNSLADRLRGRVGTGSLFDTSNLLNIGGAAQGAQNLAPNLTRTKKEEEEQRGLGSTGVF